MGFSSLHQKRGFTLIELLVVIAVIAVLMSILMPALNRAREQARWAVCMNNMSSIGKSLYLYCAGYDDLLPPELHPFMADTQNGVQHGSGYYTYFHVPNWAGRNEGYEGMGYLYKTRDIANYSDIPFCPGLKQFFGEPTTRGEMGKKWNARGNPGHRNYVGPGSVYDYGLAPEDEGIGWVNMRWSIGWRALTVTKKIRTLSAAGGARRAFLSDVWAADPHQDYWKSRLEDMPHHSGNNCKMNVWYMDGHTQIFNWNVTECFEPRNSMGNSYLSGAHTWETLFEGKPL